jgi:hypothetical protein
VNQTIQPGRYVMESAASGCYWERQSGFSGSIDDVIANDFQPYAGRAIVDILSTDVGFAFETECGDLRSYPGTGPVRRISFGAGAYVNHDEIAPGTYQASAAYGCYWDRRSSFTGELSAIIANDFIETPGTIYVTISDSDAGFYTTDDCGTWLPTFAG